MQALSAWIKQLILLVLFATFIDLLIPSTGLQRYVRLILAFLILITMLAPILFLLTEEFSLQSIAEQLLHFPTMQQEGQGMRELEGEQQRLARHQDELIEREFLQLLQGNVTQLVEATFPVRVQEVRVSWDWGPENQPIVKRLLLQLQARQQEMVAPVNGRGLRSEVQVEAIQPISIAISPIQVREQGEEAFFSPATLQEQQRELRDEQAEQNEEISRYLSQLLGLSQGQIVVKWSE